jgi:hypothetical protein
LSGHRHLFLPERATYTDELFHRQQPRYICRALGIAWPLCLLWPTLPNGIWCWDSVPVRASPYFQNGNQFVLTCSWMCGGRDRSRRRDRRFSFYRSGIVATQRGGRIRTRQTRGENIKEFSFSGRASYSGCIQGTYSLESCRGFSTFPYLIWGSGWSCRGNIDTVEVLA